MASAWLNRCSTRATQLFSCSNQTHPGGLIQIYVRVSVCAPGPAVMTCPHLQRQRAQGHAELSSLCLTKIDPHSHSQTHTCSTLAGNLTSLIWMNPNCVRGSWGDDGVLYPNCYWSHPCRRRRSVEMRSCKAWDWCFHLVDRWDEGMKTPVWPQCVTCKQDWIKLCLRLDLEKLS